jgi:hypothetical protein
MPIRTNPPAAYGNPAHTADGEPKERSEECRSRFRYNRMGGSGRVYVPAEYQHYDLVGICQRLRVDIKGEFPNLKAKD